MGAANLERLRFLLAGLRGPRVVGFEFTMTLTRSAPAKESERRALDAFGPPAANSLVARTGQTTTYGFAGHGSKTDSAHVWPVRGGQ